MKKRDLRRTFLARRVALAENQRQKMAAQISANLLGGFDFTAVRFLHYFKPIAEKNEIDTDRIVSAILASSPLTRTVVPRVPSNRRELEHIEVTQESLFEDNKWGIPEPVGGQSVDVRLIDFVLVPLLCFDLSGHRVGYGGGFYDRFLGQCRPDCFKVGLSFFGPVDEIEDIQDRDVRLNFCVTPEQLLKF